MQLTKKWGVICLSVWLILHGLALAFGLSFQGMSFVLAALAIVAGILLLFDR